MIFKNIRKDFTKFIRLFFIKNKTERNIFLGLLMLYIPIALIVVFMTSIVDHPIKEADLYFSFDNGMILRYGRTQLTTHPLIMLFYYPFLIIGNALNFVLGMKAKTILFVILSSSLISMSAVYVYRYIREIVELTKKASLSFTLFYALFSTNLILAFTPESFTLSAFFLCFAAYFFSLSIKENNPPSYLTSIIMAVVCLGGVTITNVSKGVIALFFQKESFKKRVLKILTVGCLMFAIILFFQVYFAFFAGKDYMGEIVNHKNYFITGDTQSTLDYYLYYGERMYTHFLSSPIFFPEIVSFESVHPRSLKVERVVVEGDFHCIAQYAYTAILFISMIFCFIKNIKNRYLLMLGAMFSIDLIIHIGFSFGYAYPFMYGGHWVYVVPLVLAWLYKGIVRDKNSKILHGFAWAMIAVLLINNAIRMVQFVQVSAQMYPPM